MTRFLGRLVRSARLARARSAAAGSAALAVPRAGPEEQANCAAAALPSAEDGHVPKQGAQAAAS